MPPRSDPPGVPPGVPPRSAPRSAPPERPPERPPGAPPRSDPRSDPLYNSFHMHALACRKWYSDHFAVPEYRYFWVPKYHYALHLAQDIWRFGPPRLNWCFGYEAKNQPLKKGTKRSNFKNPPMATANFWCESSDDHLRRKHARRLPTLQPGKVTASGTIAAFPSMRRELSFLAQKACLDEGTTTYSFLGGVTTHNQVIEPLGYADVALEGGQQLCQVQSLVMADGQLFAWVTAYPPSVLTYDELGVLHILRGALEASNARSLLLSMATHAFAPLWHFPQSDGSMTFISKW